MFMFFRKNFLNIVLYFTLIIYFLNEGRYNILFVLMHDNRSSNIRPNVPLGNKQIKYICERNPKVQAENYVLENKKSRDWFL